MRMRFPISWFRKRPLDFSPMPIWQWPLRSRSPLIRFLQNITGPENLSFRSAPGILEENGKRYVEKAALTEASGAHIGSMEEKHEKLSKVNPEVRVLEPHFSEDKQAVRFEFLTGKTLAEELGGQIRGKKAPVEAIQAAMEQVFSRQPCARSPFM